MHMETMLFLGWLAIALVAYAGALTAIRWTKHLRARQPTVDPEGRLEELRRRMAESDRVPRGRMAEAVRLAEGAPTGLAPRSP